MLSPPPTEGKDGPTSLKYVHLGFFMALYKIHVVQIYSAFNKAIEFLLKKSQNNNIIVIMG